jgi:hypothetical protein
MKQKVSSCLGFIFVLQLLLIAGQAQSFVLLNTVVKTTKANAITLADHSTRLALHDKQLDAMLEGTFPHEFAKQVRKYFP